MPGFQASPLWKFKVLRLPVILKSPEFHKPDLISKFTCSVYAGVMQFNTQKIYTAYIQNIYNISANEYLTKMEVERAQRNASNIETSKTKPTFYKSKWYTKKTTSGYGENADITLPRYGPTEYSEFESKEVDKIVKNHHDRLYIQQMTQSQSASAVWKEVRMSLVTASNHGKICKSRSTKSFKGHLKSSMVDSLSHIKSIAHGINNENKARQLFEETTGKLFWFSTHRWNFV